VKPNFSEFFITIIFVAMKNLTFGDAIDALKKGERVARSGWNGKKMWLKLIQPNHSIATLSYEYPVQAYIGMKTANDLFQPGWLASQNDMLAEDWYIVTNLHG
jgi:hypothetical protein